MSDIFNPHGNVTADGVLITEGLWVFTNELRVGKVVADESATPYMCCSGKLLDAGQHSKGQMHNELGWFTDHKTACETDQGACRHNHWFKIATPGGESSMDGERLATFFEGKKARPVGAGQN